MRDVVGKEPAFSAIRPPIRWAGSKRTLLNRLELLAPKRFERYVEPFAGSGALFFRLNPTRAVLGDLNADLISFYKTLAAQPRAVATGLARFRPDGGDYYWLRCVRAEELTETQAAVRFLYLNRFCFNGVYRTDRFGQFNVPRGSRTGALPTASELRAAAARLATATLRIADFEQTLSRAKTGDFLYVDPPYFTRTGVRPGEYGTNSLGGEGDLERLCDALNDLTKRGVKYLLSYSVSRALLRRIDPVWMTTVAVRRSVGGETSRRHPTRELIIANYRASGARA